MKKIVSIVLLIILILSGCSQNTSAFYKMDNGNISNLLKEEYELLANEGVLTYFGELEFKGSVEGEDKTSSHLGLAYQTGMFSIKDGNGNLLVRYLPDNEWYAIYRKVGLPEFDYSVENCDRLEIVFKTEDVENHSNCKKGMVNTEEIAYFLADVRSQKSPTEAGLYDLVTKPNGILENCYLYAVVYGFFEEEPDVAVPMEVTSYNDKAYSISIEGKEYVLPETWIQKLQEN